MYSCAINVTTSRCHNQKLYAIIPNQSQRQNQVLIICSKVIRITYYCLCTAIQVLATSSYNYAVLLVHIFQQHNKCTNGCTWHTARISYIFYLLACIFVAKMHKLTDQAQDAAATAQSISS